MATHRCDSTQELIAKAVTYAGSDTDLLGPAAPGVDVRIRTKARDRRGPYVSIHAVIAGTYDALGRLELIYGEDDPEVIRSAVEAVTLRAQEVIAREHVTQASNRLRYLAEAVYLETSHLRGSSLASHEASRAAARAAMWSGLGPEAITQAVREVAAAAIAASNEPCHRQLTAEARDDLARDIAERFTQAITAAPPTEHPDVWQDGGAGDRPAVLGALANMSEQIEQMRTVVAEAVARRDEAIRRVRVHYRTTYDVLAEHTNLSRAQLDKIIHARS